MSKYLSSLLAIGMLSLTFLAACGDDDTDAETTAFLIRIENVSQDYAAIKSGAFTTPLRAEQPSPIGPGDAYEVTFTAPLGSRLSFATMFVPSNDFFFAPDEDGIALYTADRRPVTGDITNQILLWDAGTELNQEPGLGADQVQRQAAPQTGAPDPDQTVRLAPNDFNNLPTVSDVIKATLTAGENATFTLRIENVSTPTTLVTSDEATQAVPLSPGVFVVHTDDAPLFSVGQPDRGLGLEAIAEDGMPGQLAASLAENTGVTVPLSPGVVAVHEDPRPIFGIAEPDRGLGLEALAEDGDPRNLANVLSRDSGIFSGMAFNTPVGENTPGPIGPGMVYEAEVLANFEHNLSFATMFVESNDLFFAPRPEGIALFDNMNRPISGDVTDQVLLWDAGTEVNQEPGIGIDQAPRQFAVGDGAVEGGAVLVIQDVGDGFTYPDVEDVIRVTIEPLEQPR